MDCMLHVDAYCRQAPDVDCCRFIYHGWKNERRNGVDLVIGFRSRPLYTEFKNHITSSQPRRTELSRPPMKIPDARPMNFYSRSRYNFSTRSDPNFDPAVNDDDGDDDDVDDDGG
ncbi:hypothetical protein EVAR_52765_1 [Eumeta japonica]|uniref:Uncharacterized protein n=1 Tax=Eumeta variegata TaxID=151549 RepID=A0A4C1XBQ6_EUMVA|nr:hypothetical protein EVAR_52765_1 [Eumeta japonica]